MIVHVPPDLVARLREELERAGSREIGGVLVGEHIGEAEFRVVEMSVQRSGGSVACFVRRPQAHRRFLSRFFARTGKNFERYNYLGEWHSHPLFSVEPSAIDLRQMMQIVEDGPQAPHFAVLLIARLRGKCDVEIAGQAFTPHRGPLRIDLRISGRPVHDPFGPQQRTTRGKEDTSRGA